MSYRDGETRAEKLRYELDQAGAENARLREALYDKHNPCERLQSERDRFERMYQDAEALYEEKANYLDTAIAIRKEAERVIAEKDAELTRLREEGKNRKHYSDSPRSTLHSWNDHDNLDAIGGTCGLCNALKETND